MLELRLADGLAIDDAMARRGRRRRLPGASSRTRWPPATPC